MRAGPYKRTEKAKQYQASSLNSLLSGSPTSCKKCGGCRAEKDSKSAAIHAVCSFVNGAEQQVLVVQDDDCSDPFDPFLGGALRFGDSIHATQNLTVDGTTTTGTTNVNGNSTFAVGTTATFNGNAVFNGGVTFAGMQNFSGISNTGNISTDTLSTTGNATIGGTLSVAGLATFNGISNTGNLTTDTLTANTSINTPLITATNASITTANITTATIATANVTTANIATANVTTALQVSPGASINMGGNRVQNVAAPVAGTDAANKSYVDASVVALGGQFEQALAGVNSRINDVSNRTTKATAGVAMGFAMAGVPTVLPNERVAFTMNYGNFQGQNALALNGAARLNDNLQFTGGVGYSPDQNLLGARAGLRAGW
jgi:YadA-like protein